MSDDCTIVIKHSAPARTLENKVGPIVSITVLCNGCSDLERVPGSNSNIHPICHAEGLYIESEHNETPISLVATPAWCPYLKTALARAKRGSMRNL